MRGRISHSTPTDLPGTYLVPGSGHLVRFRDRIHRYNYAVWRLIYGTRYENRILQYYRYGILVYYTYTLYTVPGTGTWCHLVPGIYRFLVLLVPVPGMVWYGMVVYTGTCMT